METPEKGDEATLPLLTPKTAGGSQRVIKQIMVIDPNKLRLAGLDVKMAEALKKAKKKSQPKSKESKLAAAKSILNKKLKEALSAKATSSPPTPSKSEISIGEAAKKLPSSEKNKVIKTKPKISVATLKSLMPPPSFPVSSLISPNQTVEIKILKPVKTKQSIEVKIVDSSGETPQTIDIFPKASLKTQKTPKNVKTQTFSPENEGKKKSSLSVEPEETGVSTQASGDTSQTVIVHLEEKIKRQNVRKGCVKEKLTSKNKSPKIVQWESPPNERESLNEKANPIAHQSESLIAEAEISMEMASEVPIQGESLPNAAESVLKIIKSTPIRRESLPKVIESKVLSPCEKIDLSILTKKNPTALTVPKKRYKLDQNWITSESNRAESVYLNLSPIPTPTPPKPVVQESAVDFINNLSLFFAESEKNKSQTKNVSEILTKECGEDATSFLVSLFQQKQDGSPKTQTTTEEKNEGGKAAPVEAHDRTSDNQKGQKISMQDSSSKKSLNTTNTQVSGLDKYNSPKKENNKTKEGQQLVETLQQTTIDASQSSARLHSETKAIQDNKSMISNSDKDTKSVEAIKSSSDLTKTDLNATILSPKADRGLHGESVSLASESSFVNESLQESVTKSSTPPPITSRRKASKPMPVLIPKLRKSRKPLSIAQKPPEETIPTKCTEKPEEESPTQPVQNKEVLKDSVPSESTPVEKKALPDKSTEAASHNEESSTMLSLASKDSAQMFDELPTTSKSDRPQRQRKISLKLIESSEFQGVVDRTVEQMIKKKKESTTPTERPQRQRKVSFKLLESSESLSTTIKPRIQNPINSNAQEIMETKELPTTTQRQQRQRRLTFKLLESSESFSTMKSLVQVNNRSVVQDNKEKVELETTTEKPQCPQKNTENSNSDSLIAIEMGNNPLKDPIAQLVAFHETVEKFELACGSVKSKRTQNTTSNLEGEGSSLSEYPFFDAICSEMPVEQGETNQPTEGKENISGEQISTKNLRKRKDSLKSRTFAGEQISIVSSDSLDIPDQPPKDLSVKQTRKREETPLICQSESEEVAENFQFTPKLTETKLHARNLESEMVQNEENFSSESKETLNNSTVLENLNVTAAVSASAQSTNIETPTNTSVKKRRGRPPKVKKQSRKLGVVEKAAEVSQPTTANNSTEAITTITCENANLGGSWETIPSTDEHQDVTQVEVVEKAAEVFPQTTENYSPIQPKTIVLHKKSNIDGSWEKLPSADKHLSQEVTTFNKSGSKISKQTTGKSRLNSYSSKSKDRDLTPDNEHKIDEVPEINSTMEENMYKAPINAEDDQNKLPAKVVIIEENETPKLTKRRGRPSKDSKRPYNLNQHQIGLKEPSDLYEVSHEGQNEEEKSSTSKSIEIFDTVPERKKVGNIIDPKEVINATKNTPDDHDTSNSTTTLLQTSETVSSQTIKTLKSFSDADKTSGEIPAEPSKVQFHIVKKQPLSRDDSNNSPKLIKTAIDIGSSGREPSTAESEICETSEIKPTYSLEPSLVECEVSRGHLTSIVDSCDHPATPETSRATKTEVKLPVRSMHNETSGAASSAVHTDESHISEKQSISKENLFAKLDEPPKIVAHFDNLMFDLDHIESPSFSPICESSRISSDSDGFEEFDEDFTSAIIETVAEAESYAEQTLEKSLNSSVFAEESQNQKNSKLTQERTSSSLTDEKSNNVKQRSVKSPENPEPAEGPNSEAVKESPSFQSSCIVTEDSICEKDKPNSSLPSFDLSKENSENSKLTDEKNSSLNSSTLAKNCPEDGKQIEAAIPDVVNSPNLVKTSEKEKEIPVSISTVLKEKSPNSSKPLDEQKSEITVPNSAFSSTDPTQKSTNQLKAKEVPTTEKKYSEVFNKSEQNKKKPRKKKAKNPFKMQKPEENEKETGNKSQIDFLGFNEKEIEEGQQSTSLRLSQSEDVEPFNIEASSTSNVKPKYIINESQTIGGKKQKVEKVKWEKNSAKSLKNWLSKPVKSGSSNDVCDINEDTKEQSSSVPPKKRRSIVQNLTEPVPLEKDVEHLEEKIDEVTEVDLSVIGESNNSSNMRENPKRGRKPKLNNVQKIEDNLCEDISSSRENINSPRKSSLISRKLLLLDAETSIDKKPKRGGKLKVTDDEEFKVPRSYRKSKVANQSISVNVKIEPSENIFTPMKGRSNKRKRSVTEENTPTTSEPPTKVAHLDRDLISTDEIKSTRKAGRPRKSMVPDPCKVAEVPAVKNSPIQRKYKDDYEFNPRLLLIRKKEELKSNEPLIDPNLQTEPKSPDDVQCALCMGYAPKKKWMQHVSSHYGIGWIVGKPPPLNIKSRGSILSFLLEFYKVSKVKGLNCRLCNSLRRSALGLLMHLEQCCLTEEEINDTRVVCEYCNRNYTKSSYLVHKRTCSEYLKQILEEAKTLDTPEGPKPDDVLSNTGRLKRKAVIMAETKLKKLDETSEFAPDDLIKHIPSKNIRSIESIKENWLMEINSFGKGFCASKTCRFTAIAIDDLIDHYQDKICPYYEKAGYFCVRCKFYNQNIEAVRSHVIDKHSPKPPRGKGDVDADIDSSESSDSISSGDDEVGSESGSFEVDENGERKPKRIKKRKSKAKRRPFQSKNPPTKEYRKLLPERCPNIQDVVAKFYDKFIETNYSLDPLFTFAKTNATHIEASESYFPKSADSMKFIHNGFQGFVKVLGESKVEPDQWKQLERLQGLTENCEYTIYMGGPVKNIAWVPLDPHPPSNTQYLAVTVRKGLDKFTRFLNQKRSRSLIFILKFDISLPSEMKAEIMYAVAIDEGPIHAIEFLPSGGYSAKMNRLGMLAVGTIETEIKIYSLPLKVEKLDCDFFPIVRLEASIELHLEMLDSSSDKADMYSSQCTCLVWSQTAGHNIIVASFLNGFVGIWDISDDAGNLNRFDLKECKMFTPVSYFWTSEDRLMHLVLHYDMNGPRWLAASNSTRKMMLYDLRDITQPLLLRVEVTINIINCIEWPVVWENILFGLGDSMPSNGCVISAFSPMSIMFSNRRFEKFCSGVTDIHFNIWRNCVAAGADNGDVQVTPLREAVLDVAQRLKMDEKTISTLDIVSLNGENISQNGIQTPSDGMRVFDKDHKDQYGIVFGSIRKIKGCNKPDYYNTHRVPPLNLQRLMRVSKIRFNQNKNACDVLAIGYDNGLLRISTDDWLKKG